MYVIASFQYSTMLELAISELERSGISRDRLLAVPLEKRPGKQRLFDPMGSMDGVSSLDGAMVVGTLGMLFGTVYGFKLTLGPILWGVIGLFAGAGVGFLLDILIHRKNRPPRKGSGEQPVDVFLMVRCEPEQQDKVREILWHNTATGIGTLDR